NLPSGDGRLRGKQSLGAFHDKFLTYTQAWITLGFLRGGFYGEAQGLADYLVSQQDGRAGGFLSLGLDEKRPRQFDMLCTGMGALASLAAGRLTEARLAGDFLCEFLSKQPPDGKSFYTAADTEGNPIKDFPPESRLLYFLDASQGGQLYFFFGTPAIFLAHLYGRFPEARYLDAARRLLELWEGCGENGCRSLGSGKCGCAAAHLFRVTGLQRYRCAAVRVAEYLMSVQSDEGSWPGGKVDPPVSISAEMIVWLSEILACV
ncbi:MAG: hypothetical protein V2A58_10690, partial [Planctomycetota bacterium]